MHCYTDLASPHISNVATVEASALEEVPETRRGWGLVVESIVFWLSSTGSEEMIAILPIPLDQICGLALALWFPPSEKAPQIECSLRK